MFKWLAQKAVGLDGKNLPALIGCVLVVGFLFSMTVIALLLAVVIKYLRS